MSNVGTISSKRVVEVDQQICFEEMLVVVEEENVELGKEEVSMGEETKRVKRS